jgi:hypothetical protein
MKQFARSLLLAAIVAGLCCGAAMAADLSTVGAWTDKYPFDKIAGGKSLWDQPGVRAAMRAAMGKRFFTLSQKEIARSRRAGRQRWQGSFRRLVMQGA